MRWLKTKLNKIMGWFGYYSNTDLPEHVENLIQAYNNALFTVDGLNSSIGYLERIRAEINGILTASILLSGQEELKLENGVLNNIFQKQLETIFINNEDGSVTCKVQIRQVPSMDDLAEELEEIEKK